MKAQPHSPTSIAAAERIEPAAETLRGKALNYLRSVNGATDEQIQQALGLNPSTARPRRVELTEKGLVVESGEARKTSSGRWAVVWKAAPRQGELL